MKKGISLILAAIMCLSLCSCGKSDACSCDCAQCAQCENKTHTTEAADISPVDNVPEAAEQNNNVIEFETPIVVAEDEYLRVELVKFYEEYRLWKQGYPYSADATTEGAILEKIVVFKICNKTDHTLSVAMSDAYLGNDGAKIFNIGSGYADDVAAGKNILKDFLILTAEEETLKSIEELYSLDGDFTVWHKGEDGVLRKNYELKFSIPNGMNESSANPAFESGTLENSIYLGKWQVTEITFADKNISSRMEEDATLWENYFKGVLGAFKNVYFVFTESGDCYYHTENGTKTGKWKETETGMQAGGTVFVAEDGKLVSEQDGYLLYWEKVSDSQELPKS